MDKSKPAVRIFLSVATAAILTAPPVQGMSQSTPAVGSVLTTPVRIESESGNQQMAEQGLLFVPENRAASDSRTIAIHFLRFPAEKPTDRAPVFLLAGGPGSIYDFTEDAQFEVAERLRRTRDVVYVGQRGNPNEPVLVPTLTVPSTPAPLDSPSTPAAARERLRGAVADAQRTWSAAGVDLAGYDILNISQDLYDLRAALGYEQIALRGCSFGSQWSMAYMKRWPQTVERALLSGIEPLDYAYDSPTGLWKGMQRLAAMAEADPDLEELIPAEGLMGAIRTLDERLEAQSETVTMPTPTGQAVDVVVGASDLQGLLRYPFGSSRREQHENWPRMILEMYNGDYRYLAAMAMFMRSGQGGENELITLLIDNSIGITPGRDSSLLADPAARWLGDINASYRNTRDMTATPQVGDDFRADFRVAYPVLLVNGDTDWSTPLENAQHELQFLDRGHLVTVKGAGHCPIAQELRDHRPELMERIYQFFEVDFSEGDDYFDTLPQSVELPAYDFSTLDGPSLYEQAMERFSRR